MKRQLGVSASERYLQRATRGLWGRKRHEVKEELEAHLHERVMAHRIAGLGETDALERALLELGNPREVSVGMIRLHTLPTLAGSGTFVAAACALVVALLPSGTAESLTGTFYWPSTKCVEALQATPAQQPSECFSIDGTFWVNQHSLQQVLEPQGVIFKKLFADNAYSAFSVTFPGAEPVFVSPRDPNMRVYDEQGVEVLPTLGYLSFWQFVHTVAFQNPVKVEGWDNPVVTLNDATFQMGNPASPIAGTEFYDNYLEAVFYQYLVADVREEYSHLTTPRTNYVYKSDRKTGTFRSVTLSLPPGAAGVYGLVIQLDAANPTIDRPRWSAARDSAFAADVAQLKPDGTITFTLPKGPLRLSDEFVPEQQPGTAVLVKLSGSGADDRGWFEVVAPEKVKVP